MLYIGSVSDCFLCVRVIRIRASAHRSSMIKTNSRDSSRLLTILYNQYKRLSQTSKRDALVWHILHFSSEITVGHSASAEKKKTLHYIYD